MDKRLLLAALALFFVAQICLAVAAPRQKNYYEMLEVEKDASAKEIKKSYFKLAMKYHPDKNLDVKDRHTLEGFFGKLSHAYQVLSTPKLRERYDVLMTQGVKEYTSEEIKADEEREASGQSSEFRSSFDIFSEVERMTDEEMAQARQEKAVLLALGIGFIGMTAYFAFKNRKIRKMIGFPLPGTVKNVNDSKELQAAIGQDRERQLAEMEKLRLKEERERAHSEKVLENVQKRREAIAQAEMEREEAEREEREKQKAFERARREAARQEALEKGEKADDEEKVDEADSEVAAHDLNGTVAQKSHKQAAFHCKPCKKSFKSEEQLENHLESNKHKQALKDAEKAARKANKA